MTATESQSVRPNMDQNLFISRSQLTENEGGTTITTCPQVPERTAARKAWAVLPAPGACARYERDRLRIHSIPSRWWASRNGGSALTSRSENFLTKALL